MRFNCMKYILMLMIEVYLDVNVTITLLEQTVF